MLLYAAVEYALHSTWSVNCENKKVTKTIQIAGISKTIKPVLSKGILANQHTMSANSLLDPATASMFCPQLNRLQPK